jgi:hypothetical protein
MAALGGVAQEGVYGVFGVGSELGHYFGHASYLFIAASESPLSEPPERDLASAGTRPSQMKMSACWLEWF